MTDENTQRTKEPHAEWCNYKHGRCDCGATDQKPRKEVPSSKTSLDRCLKFLRGFGGAHEDWVVEIEALQRNLALRNEQIDGYERQLGIDQAGAERTIGSELERLCNVTDVLKTVYRLAAGHATECQCRQCEIFELLEPIVGNTSPRSAHETSEPYLHDRANGVHGVYCIARKRDGITEYWTGKKWAAFCNDLYFDLRPAVEPTELPEALRDPVKNLERGRELLKAWGPTPVTDAALAESKESPLARAVRIARGDTGPPTEPVRFAEKASDDWRNNIRGPDNDEGHS